MSVSHPDYPGRRSSARAVADPVEVRISVEARRLLNEAGGLIVEVRERCRGTDPDPRGSPEQEDPLIVYLRDHPLARAAGADATASTLVQCDALDHFAVPRGTKAIAIWMHRRWTREIAEIHGPARPAATLRRWRRTNPRWGDG